MAAPAGLKLGLQFGLALVLPLGLALGLLAAAAGDAGAATRCRGTVPALQGNPGSGLKPVACPGRSAPSTIPVPAVEGPITENGQPFVASTGFDLGLVGYEQAEYFVTGTASAYLSTGPLGSDGVWDAVRGSTAGYRTRLIVYRPQDPAAFRGTVYVEWLNVSGGLDAAPDWTSAHTEIIRQGAAWVGVSAQFVGVEGAGASPIGLSSSLKSINPARYGSLHHPGDSFSYDMFSQAGQAVRRSGNVDLLAGLTPRQVIAVGESQSAFRLTTYVNAVDPQARVFDGFLIHSRGGGSASLSQSPQPAISTPPVVFVRRDARVPVLLFQTETDLIGLRYLPDRQADTSRIRLWEVAGTSHADTYTLSVGGQDLGNSPSVADVVVTAKPLPGIIECDVPVNSGPQHWVLKAAIAALDRWVRTGETPPRAPRLATTGTPADLARDANGNALGGIRTSYVDAPVATLSGSGQSGSGFCFLFGSTVPFDAVRLRELYPDHQSYVAAVAASTERAVRAGFLRRPDGALIQAAAEASSIGR